MQSSKLGELGSSKLGISRNGAFGRRCYFWAVKISTTEFCSAKAGQSNTTPYHSAPRPRGHPNRP